MREKKSKNKGGRITQPKVQLAITVKRILESEGRMCSHICWTCTLLEFFMNAE